MIESKRRALIIGISKYEHELLDPLSSCESDGERVYDCLRNLGYHVDRKLIGFVKYEDLRKSIIDFFTSNSVHPKDSLLFYFSGHAILDPFGDHFLATSKLDVYKPFIEGFPFSELIKMTHRCKSRKITLILDCCYSGVMAITFSTITQSNG